MVLAPLHTRLLAIASSFKHEQLDRMHRVADALSAPDAAPAAHHHHPAAQSCAGAGVKSKLRKPFNKALMKCVLLRAVGPKPLTSQLLHLFLP